MRKATPLYVSIASFFLLLCLVSTQSTGQGAPSKVAYIVDSVLVIENPVKGDDVLSDDAWSVYTLRNKDSLRLLGYQKYDAAIFVITKAYRTRPDSIKAIPSLRNMQRKNEVWFFHGTPYTGRIINYYYSGRRLADSYLVNGKKSGIEVSYYQNGNKYSEIEYREGRAEGVARSYHIDGSLQEEGQYVAGRTDGVWRAYFPNGQIMFTRRYRKARFVDTTVSYYSNGSIRDVAVYNMSEKPVPVPGHGNRNELIETAAQKLRDGDTAATLAYLNAAIQSDSTYSQTYFTRGKLEMNELHFDEAIADFDKALTIEPFEGFVSADRAFARIRKYTLAGNRTILKNKNIEVLAGSDKVTIPADETEKICSDLKMAILMGNRADMNKEALTNYCRLNMDRL